MGYHLFPGLRRSAHWRRHARYTDRQNNPEPKNVAEAFLDDTYDDDWMEHHWPNMVVTKDAE